MNQRSLKDWVRKPHFWLVLTLVFYTVFEISNGTVACSSAKNLAFTGLFSFLGFWSLVAMIITGGFMTPGKKVNYRWLALAVLIMVALSLADYYFGLRCSLDVVWPLN